MDDALMEHRVEDGSEGSHASARQNFIVDMKQSDAQLIATSDAAEMPNQSDNVTDLLSCNESLGILNYIDKQYTNDSNCVIRGFQMSGKAVKSHILEEWDVTSSLKYDCNNIVLKGSNGYYCNYCDCELCSIEEVYCHIMNGTHLRSVDEANSADGEQRNAMPKPAINEITERVETSRQAKTFSNAKLCIYVRKKNDKVYFCQICNDTQLLIWHTGLKSHIIGKSHKASLVKYGCNNVVKKSENKYYCKLCNSNIRLGRVWYHVKSEKHLRFVNQKSSDQEIYENIEQPIKESATDVKSLREANNFSMREFQPLFCRYMVRNKSNNFFCQICKDEELLIHRLYVNDHITGHRHRAALKKYGCDNIVINENNSYHCRLCDCELVDREMIYFHIKDEKHLSSLKIIYCQDMSNNSSPEKTATNPDRGNCELPNPKETCSRVKRQRPLRSINRGRSNEESHRDAAPIIEEKSQQEDIIDITAAELQRQIFIAASDDKIYFCKICDNVKFRVENEHNLRLHINKRDHRAALAKYGCDNIIPKEDNKYYCKCCNFGLSTRRAGYHHIKSKNHVRLINEEKSNKQDDRNDMETLQQAPDRPSKSTFQISPCIYVAKYSSKIYYCQICDNEKYLLYERDLNSHITDRRHKDALKKYGCGYIVLKENNNYYCSRCDSELGNLDEVYLHIKGEKHSNSLKVPYCQNMISNFVLEESTTESQCETKQNNLGSTEQVVKQKSTETAQSLFSEFSDRNLSLHYISSDRDILHKSKIAKQHADDPYCLICDFEIPGYAAVNDHIMGKCHANSLNRYGCLNIYPKSRRKFYCGFCNYLLTSIENVHRHVKTNAHLRRVREGQLNDQCEKTKKTITKIEETAERVKDPQQTGNFSEAACPTFSDLHTMQQNKFNSWNVIAGEGESQKPPEFNTIVSSLSADLSRMLAHLEVNKKIKSRSNKAKNQSTEKNKTEKKMRIRKRDFKQTSPERENEFPCTVCGIIMARKMELHSHMTSHFSKEFGHVARNADGFKNDNTEDNCNVENFIAGSQLMPEGENLSDDEDNSAAIGKIFYNCSFK